MPPLVVLDSDPGTVELDRVPAAVARGLYVHVPFCFHKCHYCDFYSITRQSPARMGRFVDLVLREARMWRSSPVTLRPQTVFFGGGTPSLLPRDEMARLIDGLHEALDLSDVDEWTIEVNPATADAEYLRALRRRGVDRLSFGAQSFDAADLAKLERHHDPADVPRALDFAREAGFERLSVDLIYAIPGQSLASWQRTLEAGLGLGTEHISCYALVYEPNTPLTVRRRLGRIAPVAEAEELAMFRHTRSRLAEAGLPAYEVSNHARPGAECRHNLVYWRGESYLGLGPSAASHLTGMRFRNQPHIGRWEEAIEDERLPAVDVETLDADLRAGELAMLRLRLAEGVDLADFQRRTGRSFSEMFADPLAELIALGLMEQTSTHVRLTEAGWPVADEIAARFLAK